MERISKHAIMLDLAWNCKASSKSDEFMGSSDMFRLFQSKKPNADGIIFEDRSKPSKAIEKEIHLELVRVKENH